MSLAERIDERYGIQQLIHEKPPWTTVWQVVDEQAGGTLLVMKRLAVPPLRAELEPRLEALRAALVRLEQNPDPLFAGIVGFFQKDKDFFIVMDRAPGKPMSDLLERGKLVVSLEQLTEAAIEIARGLQRLVETQQWMALEEFGPDTLMVTGDGQIRFIQFGLSQYLRPRGSAWTDPADNPNARTAAETKAIRTYGQLLYALWTRVPCSANQVIDIDELPETLRPVVARCVQRSQPDAYQSVKELQSDLGLLRMVHDNDVSKPAWYTPEEAAPPWQAAGVGEFVRRSAEIAVSPIKSRFNSLSVARKIVVSILFVTLVGLLAAELYHRFTSVPYVKRGAVMYSASSDGSLEIWGLSSHRLLKTVEVGEEVSSMIYNPRLHRLFLGLPADRRVMALDVDKGRLLGYTEVGTGVRAMVAHPMRPVALCLSHETSLARVGLRRLQVLDAVETHCVPLAAMFNADEKLVVVSADQPPTLRVQSDAAWSESTLDDAPVAAAVTPAADEVWIAAEGTGTDTSVKIYSATTLALKREIKVSSDHVSEIQFFNDRVYIVRKDPGLVLEVDPMTGATKHTIRVPEAIHAVTVTSASEMWIATAGNHVLVVNSATGEVLQTLATHGSPLGLILVP